VREELRALVRLAEIDGSAREIRKELDELPKTLQNMKLDVSRLEQMLEAERRSLEEARALRASHESEIAKSNEALARAKSKGAKAKNAREVEASERELEGVRRSMKDREEEKGRLAQAIAQKTSSLGDREAKLAEFRQLHDAEAVQANARIAELEKQIATVTAGRDAILGTLSKTILARYERVRTRHAVPVSEVIDGTCMGCRMHIPPQQFITLHRAESIEQCPFCHRFLYVRQALEEEGGSGPENS
jgi:predicted  nucleic acid-binding Zn-ribbon protein